VPTARPSKDLSPGCIPLLRLLSDAKFHSGEQLAAALGCSRGSVWNRVREVERLGLGVRSVRGHGYCLGEPLDLIDRGALDALLAAERPVKFRVDVLDQCASTNSQLLERAMNGASHASVIACEHQSGGRGRRGAQWVSAVGGSLAFSLLWRFQQGAGGLSGLSLAVAVAVARALESLGAGPVGVKWPNDILLGERKLGGILIEMSGDYLGPSAAVIGVGLNVRLPEAALRSIKTLRGAPAADLSSMGLAPSRTVLLARLLGSMAGVLRAFEKEGFAPLRKEWLAHHAWQGRKVALKVADRSIAQGEAVGVGDDGALLLRSGRGVERFHAGELSLSLSSGRA
jgi:BirA family biotin operon repressor/biotin-[acetyl-CoA-carboxylase] ligase